CQMFAENGARAGARGRARLQKSSSKSRPIGRSVHRRVSLRLAAVPNVLTLPALREVVDSAISELASWFVAKPRIFDMARPEQQIQFELASRLRERLRERTAN